MDCSEDMTERYNSIFKIFKKNGRAQAEEALGLSEEQRNDEIFVSNQMRRIFDNLLDNALRQNSMDDVAEKLFYRNDYFKTDLHNDDVDSFLQNNFSAWLNLEDKLFKGWFCKSSAKQRIRSTISKQLNKIDRESFSQLGIDLRLIWIGRLICYANHDSFVCSVEVLQKIEKENDIKQLSGFYLLIKEKQEIENNTTIIHNIYNQFANVTYNRLQNLTTSLYGDIEQKPKLSELKPYEGGLGDYYNIHDLHYRLPRKYGNTTVQFLRHVARVLYYQMLPYFYKINGNETIQEVQVMLVKEDSSPCKVFVALSPRPPEPIQQITELKKESLLETPKINGLSNDLQNKYKKETKRAFHHSVKKVKAMKANGYLQSIWDLLYDTNGKINLLQHNYNSGDDRRHAEEYLCDKAKELKSNLKFYIYGKKRPCMTCSGRMKHVGIDHFNPRPGLIFRYAFDNQPDEVKRSSLELIRTTPSHITFTERRYNGNSYSTSYDTDSESESESDIVFDFEQPGSSSSSQESQEDDNAESSAQDYENSRADKVRGKKRKPEKYQSRPHQQRRSKRLQKRYKYDEV